MDNTDFDAELVRKLILDRIKYEQWLERRLELYQHSPALYFYLEAFEQQFIVWWNLRDGLKLFGRN